MQVSGGVTTVTRMGPGGAVATFPFPGLDTSHFGAGTGAGAFGGAWTYGNGNLGFTNNAGGTVQVSVSGAASTSPTFLAVSYMSGPGSGNNDAAASPGTPVDLAIVKDVDAAVKQIGDTATYSITVTNTTSDAISSGYTITDVVPNYLTISPASVPAHCAIAGQQISCAEGTLAPGASLTRTFEAVVNTNASRGLSVVNPASVLGNEADSNTANNSDTAEITVIAASMTLLKTAAYTDANDNGNPDLGETVTWTFRVTNDGDLVATGVTVDDPTVGPATPASATIAAGESVNFSAIGIVTQQHVDDGLITNTATATGVMAGEPYTTNSSTATLAVRPFPSLQAVKSHVLVDGDGNALADVGETIEYTIRVSNTGNVTLTGVTVDDPMLAGVIAPLAVDLAPGASQDFTGDYVVTADDVTSGAVTNSAVARGTPPDGPEISTPPSTTTQDVLRTGITLVKSAVDPAAVATTVGQLIEYRFVVTNTGNTALQGVTIADPMLDAVPAAINIPAGEQREILGTHTVTQSDIDDTIADGFFTNTATASGTPVGGTLIVSNTSSVNVPSVASPLLELTKSYTLNDLNGDGLADAGETIDYVVTAINAGNVTLVNVTVNDDKFAPSTRNIGTLVPGAVHAETFAGYVVTQADVDAGEVPNAASGTAEYPSGTPIAPPPPATTVTPTGGDPLLHIVKRAVLNDANANGVADADETIQFTVDVWNHGEVSANGVDIVDPKAGAFAPSGVTIAPGARVTFTAGAFVVTTADVTVGSVDNTAHATGLDPRTAAPLRSNDSSTSTPTPAPQLQLRKLASLVDSNNNGMGDVGETIVYSFLVSNNGNVTIEDISVSDARVTGLAPSGFALNPGAAISVSADAYVVTDADVVAGSVVNSATASGTPVGGTPLTTPPSSTLTPTVAAVSALMIVKNAALDDANSNGVADLGETIMYTFDVTNTGTLTVTGVTVTDARVTGITPASAELIPNQMVTFSAAPYIVVQTDIDAGAVLNEATANGTSPQRPVTPPTDTSTVPTAPQTPAMTATKVGTLNDSNANGVADEGETIIYTVTLLNTGNVTLTDAFPDDPRVSGFTPSAGVTLAPAASQAFVSAPYTVTPADVAAGSVLNTATGTATTPGGGTIPTPPTTYEIPTFDPGMLLEKTASLADANGNGMADLGEVVTYTFTVTNTGNVTLENVSIVDPRVSAVAPVSSTIAVGDDAVFTATYVVTEADILAQSLSNTATATGTSPGNPTLIQTPPDTATVPPAPIDSRLEIVKAASLADANGNGYADEGEIIDYSFTVTNPGNITVLNVTVVDAKVTGLAPAVIASMLPGASETVTADPYVVTAADIAAGGVVNVATATGTDAGGTAVVSSQSTSTVPTPPVPALQLTGPEGIWAWVATAAGGILLGLMLLLCALYARRTRQFA